MRNLVLVKTYKGTKGKKRDKDKKKTQSQGKPERALGAKKGKRKEIYLVKHLPFMKSSTTNNEPSMLYFSSQ